MTAYIIRRCLHGLVVITLLSVFIFLAMHLLPGDPLVYYVDEDALLKYTDEQREALIHELGLDKSLMTQYVDWISGMFRGDFGLSLNYHEQVSELIIQSLPITLHLGVTSFIISSILGIIAGLIAAVRRGRWLDTTVNILAITGATVPIFWLAMILVYLFGLKLGWLPVMGYTSPFDNFWLNTRQIIMPVFCMSLVHLGVLMRQTRSSVLEVMRQDYIRTAWSKGLREQTVIKNHALKNGLIPVVTVLGVYAAHIFNGAVLIETVFNIPGMGRLVAQSAFERDFPVIQGITILIAVGVVLVNLIVDILYGWLDPRIRYN